MVLNINITFQPKVVTLIIREQLCYYAMCEANGDQRPEIHIFVCDCENFGAFGKNYSVGGRVLNELEV